jgi:DNA-binding response OmpR family regulator
VPSRHRLSAFQGAEFRSIEGTPDRHPGATNGGWTLLENMAGRIDLVVSDIVMPRLDGVDLARCMEIMSHPPPILFMSGYGLHPTDCEWPLLVKPFRAHELLEAVHRLLVRGQDDQRSSDATPS